MLTAKQPSNSKDTGGERNSNTPFFSRHTIQAKLQVNEPGDSYEREADAMADHVMRMTDVSADRPTFFKPATSTIQRKCQHCEDEEMLHRKESSGNEVQGSNELDGYVSSLKSSGTALPETSRSFFEPRFGHDFSNVRIHTDSVAAKSAQSINALAYTTGNNIVFNSGQYSPGSDSGKRLMAHELTHVVQQHGGENKLQKKAIHNGRILNFGSFENWVCNDKYSCESPDGQVCPENTKHKGKKMKPLTKCDKDCDHALAFSDHLIAIPNSRFKKSGSQCNQDLVVCANKHFAHGKIRERSDKESFEVGPGILEELSINGGDNSDIKNGAIYPDINDSDFKKDKICGF